jgi:hypothetical protein
MKPRKPSRFLPKPGVWEEKTEPSRDGLEWLTARASQSLCILRERGWKGGENAGNEGWAVVFVRRVAGKVEFLRGSHGDPDPVDALHYNIFKHCDDARQAYERGDYKRALYWSTLAGFYMGKGNDVLIESERAGTKKRGQTKIRDAVYLEAIARAGPGAGFKDIVVLMDPKAFKRATESAHRKRIAALKDSSENR